MVGGLVFAACSSDDDSSTTASSDEPAAEETADEETDSEEPPEEETASEETTGEDGELILDYTLYVEGGIQVSGLDVSPDEGTVALVTDFEKVIIYDVEDAAVASEFSVQLGDLPRQGATEAVTFTSADEVAVLYPGANLVRRYDLAGEMTDEVDLSGIGSELAEGMTALEDGSLLVATGGPTPALVPVEADGTAGEPVELQVEEEIGEIVGVSPAGEDADTVYLGTEEGNLFLADLATGEVDPLPEIPEVGELSDLVYFVNPEGERVIAVTDDSNEYNDVEGPIRLYLAP